MGEVPPILTDRDALDRFLDTIPNEALIASLEKSSPGWRVVLEQIDEDDDA